VRLHDVAAGAVVKVYTPHTGGCVETCEGGVREVWEGSSCVRIEGRVLTQWLDWLLCCDSRSTHHTQVPVLRHLREV
jgi:hypothetical protein